MANSFDHLIGKKIKNFRDFYEISVEMLAAKTGIETERIRSYESGKESIPISRLYKITSVFNVSLSYFLKDW